ncbi:MAG: hypothetical protein AAGD12_15260 [Pseudomonadota bacterium]
MAGVGHLTLGLALALAVTACGAPAPEQPARDARVPSAVEWSCSTAPNGQRYDAEETRKIISTGWDAIRQNRPMDAVDLLDTAKEYGIPMQGAYWGLAVAGHMLDASLARVRVCFDRAIAFDDSQAGLFSDYARVLEERRLPREALEKAKTALAIDPDHVEALIAAGRAEMQLGNDAAAAAYAARVEALRN